MEGTNQINIITWGWESFGLINMILSIVIVLLAYGFLFFVAFKVVKRKSGYIFLGVTLLIMIFAILFSLVPVLIGDAAIIAGGLAIYGFSNLGDFRSFTANPFKRAQAKNTNFTLQKIFDRKEMYAEIEKAITSLSKTRTGAIITFERNTSLSEIMKNGVNVHAPVNSDLLITIFYPGTRLHDGAVVIKGNEIVSASVFFTPTTKPFAVKYGSRHRAAIGVSEVSDSVTVVVSEETGRISIAYNGELNVVDPQNFLNTFETYMDLASKSDEDAM